MKRDASALDAQLHERNSSEKSKCYMILARSDLLANRNVEDSQQMSGCQGGRRRTGQAQALRSLWSSSVKHHHAGQGGRNPEWALHKMWPGIDGFSM